MAGSLRGFSFQAVRVRGEEGLISVLQRLGIRGVQVFGTQRLSREQVFKNAVERLGMKGSKSLPWRRTKNLLKDLG